MVELCVSRKSSVMYLPSAFATVIHLAKPLYVCEISVMADLVLILPRHKSRFLFSLNGTISFGNRAVTLHAKHGFPLHTGCCSPLVAVPPRDLTRKMKPSIMRSFLLVKSHLLPSGCTQPSVSINPWSSSVLCLTELYKYCSGMCLLLITPSSLNFGSNPLKVYLNAAFGFLTS